MFSILAGFMLPFRGLALLGKPGVRRFVVIPLLLNVALFAGIAYLAGDYFDAFMASYLPEDSWLSFLRPVLWVIFAVGYAVAVFYTFTILANLFASPFNGILAARIEQKLTGQIPPDSDTSVVAAIPQAIAGETSKIIYFIKRAIPLGVLLLIGIFIPLLSPVATVLWIGFGFWFLAIEYADYPMGNYELKPGEQRAILARKRMKSLGFGAGATVMLLIPVLWFFAMPAAVAGATRFWVEDLKPLKDQAGS